MVECVFGDDFSCVAVDGDGVVVVDEGDDACASVFVGDVEFAEFAGVSEGDFAVVVDFVVAYSPYVVAVLYGGEGFWCGGVGVVGCVSV